MGEPMTKSVEEARTYGGKHLNDIERAYFAGNWRGLPTHVPDLIAHIRDLQAALTAERKKGEEQERIVSRIWAQLGNPTYEDLAGRSIHDLIDELKAALATAEADGYDDVHDAHNEIWHQLQKAEEMVRALAQPNEESAP